ncbi:hypothetical protein LWI29_029983 [Acer saccharum]|uniref:Uncharacterized protein n=1 Tax=Acer saccharum TaxID=4024 RepID=A0AA39VCY8_ACESA|nr:hypothetical protein LWI29_029983 [Acer saccharum]
MTNIYNKLKEMKVEVGDQFLVWQVLESLPSQFDTLKTSYNTHKEVWDLSTMSAIVILIQEEEILKTRKSFSALTVTHDNTAAKKIPIKGITSKNSFKRTKSLSSLLPKQG